MSYDVIVVGAGSAGCVLATRLSEDRACRVLLLEAGPDYPLRSELPVDLADGTCLPSERVFGHHDRLQHDWHLESVPGSAGTPAVPLPRGRVVGGSSAVNGTFALRGHPDDYDAWGAAGNPGWDARKAEETFCRLERDLDFGDRPWHGTEGPVPIRRHPPGEQSLVTRTFLEAAVAAGHPAVADHNEPGVVGAGPLPVNTLDWLRMSAALTHLEPARGRPNLTVRSSANVDRVEIVSGRAVGVRVAGGERIYAGLVVLSAGAYLSPVVLQRSGIGPADVLAEAGVVPVVDLPGVGRNLADHVLVSVDIAVRPGPAKRHHYQNMITWRSDREHGPPDLHLFACGPYAVRRDGEPLDLVPLVVGLLDPASRGEVRIRSADPAAVPHIDLGYLTDPDGRDLDRLVDGVRQMRRIAATEPLRSLIVGAERSPGRDADLRAVIPQLVRTYHHPAGTCAMGPDAGAGAVVDARGRVHGVDALVVADAAIMPRIPRANTNLPTMMLADRIADLLTAEVRSPIGAAVGGGPAGGE